MAFYFNTGKMNQSLKAISLIKNTPESSYGSRISTVCVRVAVSFRLLELIGVTS